MTRGEMPGDGAASSSSTGALAVDAVRAGKLVGVSRAHWLRLVRTGRAPAGVRLGRRRLWPVRELESWLAAGAPPRERWEALRAREEQR